MKKILIVSAVAVLGLTSVAFAGGLQEEMPAAPIATPSSDATGIYLGLSGGMGFTNWNNTVGAKKDNGFAGRVFAGYDINRYFAVETGYSYFFNKANVPAFNYTNVKTQTVDLCVKGKLPVVDSLDFFAKLGAGWMFSKATVPAGSTYSGKNNNINVTYGVGADYSITSNIIASAEWLRVNGYPRFAVAGYQPNTDAFLVGVRYKFDL